jgi:hypothetical protein
MSSEEVENGFKVLTKVLLLSFIIVMLLSYLIAMGLGPLISFFTESGSEVANRPIKFDFFIVGYPYSIPLEFNAGWGFMACWAIYLSAFFVSYVSGEKFHQLVRKQEYRYSDLTKNFLFSMPIVMSLFYTALVTIILVQLVLGIPPGSNIVSQAPHQLTMFFYLTYSPITEEIGFRIIPIGLLTVINLAVVRRKSITSKTKFLKVFALGFLFPNKAKEITLGNNSRFGFFKRITFLEWTGIIFTSVLFGFAHYYFGAWSVGKIMTSTVFGIVLALAYLIYGIHAPILMHWWFNYYFEAYFQAYRLTPSIPWVSIISFLWLVLLIGGSIGWILVSPKRETKLRAV